MDDASPVLADVATACDRDQIRRRRLWRGLAPVRRLAFAALAATVIGAIFGVLVYVQTAG